MARTLAKFRPRGEHHRGPGRAAHARPANIKTLVYVADGKLVVAIVRGDDLTG